MSEKNHIKVKDYEGQDRRHIGHFGIDPKISLGSILGFVVYSITVVWFLAQQDGNIQQNAIAIVGNAGRIERVENKLVAITNTQNSIVERLARIEEKGNTTNILLQRIDVQLGKLSERRPIKRSQ